MAGKGSIFVNAQGHLGKGFITYGQTKIQEDLYTAAGRRGASVLSEVHDVHLSELNTEKPRIRCSVGW